MQVLDGQPVYSATDLVGFLECAHLTELERAALKGLVDRPHEVDLELDVLRRRGAQHEERYLAELEAGGRTVVRIERDASPDETPGDGLRAAAAETLTAMANGADVIYQATFFDGTWRGHADFLLKVDAPERPSHWGPYHYEVADTKLARHVKAGAVLQICVYVDLLTAVQGVEPERLHVVLGGSAGGARVLRVADYMAYYRSVRGRFDAAVGEAAPAPAYPSGQTYPDPVEHCEVCRWTVVCKRRRRDDDHLSLVAGISRRQREGLTGRGVETLAQLAVLPLPVVPPLDGSSPGSVMRVREQARIQLAGRERGEALSEFLDTGSVPEPGTGLAALPPPSPGDLFFDIEGDPFAADDGLDYLFGVMDVDGTWHALWSRDAQGEFNLDGEKAAFEKLVDLFNARLWTFPDAHIYHFAPYEPTAMKRLMGRHATCENEVDRLLRGGAFVDLHRVVKQSVRASVESYGIKSLEALYGFTREVDLRDAGSSIVAFEEWLQLGEGDRPAADHLARIEAYNRDDVVSNRRLRDWLEERRAELRQLVGSEIPRPGPRNPEPSPELNERQQEVADLADRLAGDAPEEGRTPDQQARWLLAQLLSWHRREKKSAWWMFFHLKDDMTDAERIEAGEPIAGLQYRGVVGEMAQSQVHRYSFPLQDYDIKVGSTVVDPATWGVPGMGSPGEVVALDQANRTIDLKRGKKNPAPHPSSLIPFDDYKTPEQEKALLRLGRWVAEHGLDGDGPYRAALDLLQARRPRVGQAPGAALRKDDEADLTAARRLGLALDRSTLPIQGPPGSGKTYGGAHMALDLVAAGRRIGVTATSHKVISNFLRALLAAADEERVPVSVIQKAGDDGTDIEHPAYRLAASNAEVRDALASGTATVGAGTTWLWAREEMTGSVDVLFVDEAGQMSLANVLSAAGCAASLVLLGDPQQLDQPLQGSHPPGADRSALAHLLGEASTIDPRAGLFLEYTRRLHPDLTRFTSEVFYDSRLDSKPGLERQVLRGPDPTNGTGPRLLTVEHTGNDHDSIEEADAVATLARALVEGGACWTDEDGAEHAIDWTQLVIVAAYNAQVGLIQERVPPEARVGTVDKFQGQEAPISIYSMASSSADDAPRGMDFLYSGHRLNVATSRARCVALIVASPELFRVRARNPEQMRLANAFARFAERAKGV